MTPKSPISVSDDGDVPTGALPVLPPVPESLPMIQPVVDGDAEAQVLSKLTARGWFKVTRCKGVTARLREPGPEDALDCDDQTHLWEVRCSPATDKKPPNRPYAASTFCKLSAENQDHYEELADNYFSKGWWWPALETNAKLAPHIANQLGVAEVFLHVPTGRAKRRLVIDARGLNSQLGAASSDTPRLREILCALRCVSPPCVCVRDLKECFYKIRLARPGLLRLNLGSRSGKAQPVDSDRINFGTGPGPTIAGNSVDPMVGETVIVLAPTGIYVAIYVDDLPMGGGPNRLPHFVATTLGVLRRAGFEVSYKKFQAVSAPSCAPVFLKNLHKYNINVDSLDEMAGLLGVKVGYATTPSREVFRVDCAREDRLAKASVTTKAALASKTITRRDCFAIAGQAGFDPASVHAEVRLWCDALRSLVGGRSSHLGWDVPLRFADDDDSHFDKLDRQLMSLILNKILQATESGPCQHDTPVF